MSAFTGPIIDVADKEDLLCAFHPEIPIPFGNGQSLGQEVVDTQSFNKTNVSKYITSTIEGNDGYWGNNARSIDPVVISRGLSNQENGVYTSFSGEKIYNPNIMRYQYNFDNPISNYFITNNGLTICGFFKVDKFPSINNSIKKRLGIVSINYGNYFDATDSNSKISGSGIGLHRIGVRRDENNGLKFSIGAQTTIYGTVSFSIMSDYVYDVGKWYFFSYSINFVEQGFNEDFFQCRLSVNGQPVTTYFAKGIKLFYHKTGRKRVRPMSIPSLQNFFPITNGFKNINNTVVPIGVLNPLDMGFTSADGEQALSSMNTVHNIYPAWYSGNNIRSIGIGSPIKEKIDNDIRLYFSQIPTFRKQGGYHDNISFGSHFIFKSVTSSQKLYETYKKLYL